MQPESDGKDQAMAQWAGSSSAQVVVRKAGMADFEDIMRMLSQMVRDNPSGHPQNWAESGDARDLVTSHLEKGRGWIAEQDGQVIGHLGWRMGRAHLPQHAVFYREVASIYVEPECRELNVARRLFQVFLQDCKENQVRDIRVSALPDPACIAMFESLGFVEQRREMKFDGFES